MQKLEVLPQTATLKYMETRNPKSKTNPCLLGLFVFIPMMGGGYFAIGNHQQFIALANAKLQDSQFALRLAENDL